MESRAQYKDSVIIPDGHVGERISSFLLTAVVHARFRQNAESFEKLTRGRRSGNPMAFDMRSNLCLSTRVLL